jgi:hypothetical protein
VIICSNVSSEEKARVELCSISPKKPSLFVRSRRFDQPVDFSHRFGCIRSFGADLHRRAFGCLRSKENSARPQKNFGSVRGK